MTVEIFPKTDQRVEFDGVRLSERYGTRFFELAQRVIEIENLPGKISSTRFNFNFHDSPIDGKPEAFLEVNRRLGRERPTRGMESTICLPNFPKDVIVPRIITIESPESNALFAGRWTVRKDGIFFVPTRLDTGVPVQTDIGELTRQLVRLPQFLAILNPLDELEFKMFITDLIRDPGIKLQDAIWQLILRTIPRTQLDVHHVKTDDKDNPFGRYPEDKNNLKLEGIDFERCDTLIFCDPFASGMQLCKALEEHLGKIRENNGGRHNIKHLVIFAPLATLEGASIIAYLACENGIQTTIFSSAAILHARLPQMYWCPPFKGQEHLVVNPKLLKLIEITEGESNAYYLDRWCDWAAKRISPPQALRASEEFELNSLGLTNQMFLDRARKLIPKQIRELGLNPVDFVSLATIKEAVYTHKEEGLIKFISGL